MSQGYLHTGVGGWWDSLRLHLPALTLTAPLGSPDTVPWSAVHSPLPGAGCRWNHLSGSTCDETWMETNHPSTRIPSDGGGGMGTCNDSDQPHGPSRPRGAELGW